MDGLTNSNGETEDGAVAQVPFLDLPSCSIFGPKSEYAVQEAAFEIDGETEGARNTHRSTKTDLR